MIWPPLLQLFELKSLVAQKTVFFAQKQSIIWTALWTNLNFEIRRISLIDDQENKTYVSVHIPLILLLSSV